MFQSRLSGIYLRFKMVLVLAYLLKPNPLENIFDKMAMVTREMEKP
jgi:hypothetical protein